MNGICERCKAWSPILEWVSHAELCPQCKADNFGEEYAAGAVRGTCDWCGHLSSDLRARDGKSLCASCDEPLRRAFGETFQRSTLDRSAFTIGLGLGFIIGVAAAALFVLLPRL